LYFFLCQRFFKINLENEILEGKTAAVIRGPLVTDSQQFIKTQEASTGTKADSGDSGSMAKRAL